MQYIWVPERAQSTLTAGQPANNIKMQVMRSCADTRSRRRNKFGYSSLSNHKLLSSASRLNTLARRQARIVVMHACECTQLNVTTRRAIQKRNVRLTHLDKQTHTHTHVQIMLHAEHPQERLYTSFVTHLHGHPFLWWPLTFLKRCLQPSDSHRQAGKPQSCDFDSHYHKKKPCSCTKNSWESSAESLMGKQPLTAQTSAGL